MNDYRIYAVGDSALTVELANTINKVINNRVITLSRLLEALKVFGVLDIIPSYGCVSVIYDVVKIRSKHPSAANYIIEQISDAVRNTDSALINLNRTIEIPVCYDVSLGIDLEEMSLQKKISIPEIIALHTSKLYRVYMLGFLPGFTYMGEVDERIATPRKKSPRLKIEAGSVGIADNQTGVYPFDSPGGWNIIGKTPLKLFDSKKENPIFFQSGDNIIFKPITLEVYNSMQRDSLPNVNEVRPLSSGKNQMYTHLEILKPGIADSFQDLGRYGFQHLGINPNGAMDKIAAQTANFLVGNTNDEAVLECHFPASSIFFNHSTVIALSGADFTAAIDEYEIPLNTPVLIQKGATLNFKKWKNGARTYLAVKNGFAIPKWLNSYSTHTIAKAGGFRGRNLKSGDQLKLKNENLKSNSEKINESNLNPKFFLFPWHVEIDNLYDFDTIEIIMGNDFDELTEESKINFLSNEFLISSRSNKMGYRLEGETLKFKNENTSILSSAVTRGTMQLLPNGQIIILMSDHQTTGGYPKIGNVTSAAFSSLAQLPPNKKIRFKIISIGAAEEKMSRQHQYLQKIKIACQLKLK